MKLLLGNSDGCTPSLRTQAEDDDCLLPIISKATELTTTCPTLWIEILAQLVRDI